MVVRLHRQLVAEHGAEARPVLDPHRMVGERAHDLAMRLAADNLGEVLYEVAAARDVEHLRAATHREHRQVARERRLEQRQLRAVARRARPGRLRVRLRAVGLRVEVGAAGEDEPVERVDDLLHPVLDRRDEQRRPARALDRLHVHVRDERGVELPVTPRRRLDVRGDSHHGPTSHARTSAPARSR